MKMIVARLFAVAVALTLIPSAVASEPNVVARVSRSVVLVLAGDAQGSAFAFGRAGEYLTNAHVVRGVDKVVLLTVGGRRFSAMVVARNDRTDVAELRSPVALPALKAAQPPRAGDKVLAIGASSGLVGTVTEGIVSAVHRDVNGVEMIQTDAAVNPGSSGGVLINAEGRVLGITTSLEPDSQGIAFAIPITTAEKSAVSRSSLRAAQVKRTAGLGVAWLLGIAVFAIAILGAAAFLLRNVRAGQQGRLRPTSVVPRSDARDFLDPVVIIRRRPARQAEADTTPDIHARHRLERRTNGPDGG
jgi:Trypsin-like peptidase domain